jgi:hypothetical protein
MGMRGLEKDLMLTMTEHLFICFAYQGKKDIVFRIIIEYSSLSNFGP